MVATQVGSSVVSDEQLDAAGFAAALGGKSPQKEKAPRKRNRKLQGEVSPGVLTGFTPVFTSLGGQELGELLQDSGSSYSLLMPMSSLRMEVATSIAGNPYPVVRPLRADFRHVETAGRRTVMRYCMTTVPVAESAEDQARRGQLAVAMAGLTHVGQSDKFTKWIPELYALESWEGVDWEDLPVHQILQRIYQDLRSATAGKVRLNGNFQVASASPAGGGSKFVNLVPIDSGDVGVSAKSAENLIQRDAPPLGLRVCRAPEFKKGQVLTPQSDCGYVSPRVWADWAKGTFAEFLGKVTGHEGARSIAAEVAANWLRSKSIAASGWQYFVPLVGFNEPREVYIDLGITGAPEVGRWINSAGLDENGPDCWVGPHTELFKGARTLQLGVETLIELL